VGILPKFFEYPVLSQEGVKLRSSNFVCTFIGSIGTKLQQESLAIAKMTARCALYISYSP